MEYWILYEIDSQDINEHGNKEIIVHDDIKQHKAALEELKTESVFIIAYGSGEINLYE